MRSSSVARQSGKHSREGGSLTVTKLSVLFGRRRVRQTLLTCFVLLPPTCDASTTGFTRLPVYDYRPPKGGCTWKGRPFSQEVAHKNFGNVPGSRALFVDSLGAVATMFSVSITILLTTRVCSLIAYTDRALRQPPRSFFPRTSVV